MSDLTARALLFAFLWLTMLIPLGIGVARYGLAVMIKRLFAAPDLSGLHFKTDVSDDEAKRGADADLWRDL